MHKTECGDRIIYLTRDSFCMADDVMAPNIAKFTWRDSDWVPEVGAFRIVEEYLGSNLPGFYWRGYADGKQWVDVHLHREDLLFRREIVLVDNWREMLQESLCIHFLHQEYSDKDKLPTTISSGYYSYKEAEKIYKKYSGHGR